MSKASRRGAVIAAAVAVACTAGAGGAGAVNERAAKHKTTVRISSKVPAFHGRVRSGFDPCIRNRRVILFRKAAGSDKRLGSDRSSSTGRWGVRVDNLKSGAYYAKAKRKTKPRSSCRPARSKVVVVD